MRFTVIGHACLRIETSGPTILVDPWLTGSCYWRSWWHFPADADPTPELLAPDVVYLTHHHFDHFHYPSMRQVDKGAEVLCARFGVDVMADEVRDLGFRTVSELPHGEIRELAPGVRVASYQYGFDDTAFVVADGDTVLADLNDCKIRGRALRQIAEDFGPVTFLLKTHSWAQSYPHLYEAEDAEDLTLLKRQTYLDEFIDATRTLQPRFAVPFANMVAFLHPESWAMNAEMITPDEVRAAFERADGLEHTALVAMSPGDRWSDERGFDVSGTRWWDDRLPRMSQMAAAVAPTLAATAAEEAQRPLAFADFEHHLSGFLQAVPRPALRMLLKRPIVFEVPTRRAAVLGGRRPPSPCLAPGHPAGGPGQPDPRRPGGPGRRHREADPALRPRLHAHPGGPASRRGERGPRLLGPAHDLGDRLPAGAQPGLPPLPGRRLASAS